MIRLTDVWKSFDEGRSFVVKGISLEVVKGETLVLLGSSGSGKTTTLEMINRLEDPTRGKIEFDEKNIMDMDLIQLRRSFGYVFQGIGLFPHLTVKENISIIPRLMGASAKAQSNRARELLKLIGLEPDLFADRYPNELSGGQQQRVGVARALAANPECLLMDEPFGALDAMTREVLQQELLSLKDRVGKTIVFVTHDILEAFILADRIAVMHEGCIDQIGTREELVKHPATEFVSDLLSKPINQLSKYFNFHHEGAGMFES